MAARPDARSLYLVKSTSWSTDDGIALHFVTDSLDQNTTFEESDALAISGNHYSVVVPSDGDAAASFLVGLGDESAFQRYVVSDTGEISLGNKIDFTNLGVADGRTLMRASKIMSATKAYAVDADSLQVVVFNPTAMTITKTISLASLDEATLPNRWSIFPTSNGDTFIAAISYYGANWEAVAHTKLVAIDSTTDALTSDTSTDCGGVSTSAKDAAGNIYFASHDDVALYYHLSDPYYQHPPCIIKVDALTNTWDDNYAMNMQGLTNDARLPMAAMTGNGDKAYTLILSDAAQQNITVDTGFRDLIRNVWEFHSFDITDDMATATKVNNVNLTTSRPKYGVVDHAELGEVSWMMTINDNYTESLIYNTTDDSAWSTLITVPGELETIGRLR